MSFELNFEDEGADLSKFWWMCCLMKVFEIQAHRCCQSKLTLKLVKFHQANLFLAVFSRLEPIWSGVRSPTQLPSQSRQALLVRVETCLLWLVFLPSPSFLTSSSPASKSSSRRSRWKFVQNREIFLQKAALQNQHLQRTFVNWWKVESWNQNEKFVYIT